MSENETDPAPDAAFQPPSLEELGALLPQFEMQDFLAQGGMGAVYLARQISLDRRVAIKVLPPAWGSDAASAKRFHTEARALAKLHHNHIVGVFDFGTTSAGHLFLVMEYVRGQNLHEMIRYKRLPVDKVQGLALQLCDAVAFAHENGVLHRDIKPGNVLVSTAGEVKMADFGLARNAGAAVEEESLGTPDYAAPELLQEGALVDHRADIYAIGIVLQEMLTGSVPRRPREPLREHGTFDPAWEPIIAKATHAEPAKRFATVRELREAVALVGRRDAKPPPPPPASRESAARSRPPGPMRAPGPPRPSAPQRASRPQGTPFPWMVVVFLMVIIGVGAFFLLRKSSDGKRDHDAGRGITPAAVAPSSVADIPWENVRPGHFFKMPDGHKDFIYDVAAFPGRALVASASADGTVVVWNLKERSRVRTFGPVPGSVGRIAISPDGRHIAAGSNQFRAYLFSMDAPPGAAPRQVSVDARAVSQLAFVGESAIVLGPSDPGSSLQVWDWSKGALDVIPGYRPAAHAIVPMPGDNPNAFVVLGQRPDSGGVITEFWLADARRKSLERELPRPPAAFHLRLTPDGHYAVAAGKGQLFTWELQSGRVVARSTMIPGGLSSDTELLDGGRLVLAGGLDRRLHVIEVATGVGVWTSPPAESQCTSAPAALFNGRFIVSGGGRRVVDGRFQKDGDYALHVWALPDLAMLKTGRPDRILGPPAPR